MPVAKRPDRRLVRTDDSWLTLPNPAGVPVEICAGPEVPIESAAVDELLTVLQTASTLSDLAAATPGLEVEPRIDKVVCTPDFHKGAGIPIGTVLRTVGALMPQAVGNDINCGMRVEVTSLTVDRVRPHLDALEQRLRHLFFEGGRQIGLTPAHREGLLQRGADGAQWLAVAGPPGERHRPRPGARRLAAYGADAVEPDPADAARRTRRGGPGTLSDRLR